MVPAAKTSGPSLAFATLGKLSGSTGCNSFSGNYKTSGSKMTITLGPMTQIACADRTLSAQESAIIDQLPTVATYTINSDVLTLTDISHAELFTYKAAANTLAGTAWDITGVNNGKGAVEASNLTEKLTASFAANDMFSGFGGCNQLNGPYQLTGPQGLSIGPLTSTLKTCGSAVDQLEAEYKAALGHVSRYELKAGTLTLRDDNNTTQITAKAHPRP